MGLCKERTALPSDMTNKRGSAKYIRTQLVRTIYLREPYTSRGNTTAAALPVTDAVISSSARKTPIQSSFRFTPARATASPTAIVGGEIVAEQHECKYSALKVFIVSIVVPTQSLGKTAQYILNDGSTEQRFTKLPVLGCSI
jgi:hypothetical protein